MSHFLNRIAASGMLLLALLLSQSAHAAWDFKINIGATNNSFTVESNSAIDARGILHTVYKEFINGNDVQIRYTLAAGGIVFARTTLARGDRGGTPIVNITPDNIIHVTYHLNGMVWEISKPLDSLQWSVPLRIDTAAAGVDAWHGHTAMDATGGLYSVYLVSWFKPDSKGILVGRYKPLGGVWGAPEVIRNGTPGDLPDGAFVTVSGTYIWVTYQLGKQAFIKYKPNGSPNNLSPEALISTIPGKTGHYGISPRIYKSNRGEYALLWVQDMDGDAKNKWFEVMVKFSTEGGGWTPPMNVSNHNGLDRFAEAAFDDRGNFHVVWQSTNSRIGKEEVVSRSRINGTWTNTRTIATGVLAKGAIKPYGDWLLLNYSANNNGFYTATYSSMPAPASPW